jgi:rhodanese-related sulfurtransferase
MFNFLRPGQKSISLPDLLAQAATGEAVLIDVREGAELRTSGTAKGALHIPLALIAMKADPKSPDFDKRLAGKKIGVFCASGGRSGMAQQVLQKLGYEVVNLGGFAGLVQAGAKVTKV